MKQVQNHNRDLFCTIDKCGKEHMAMGYCSVHYTRWYTKGSPTAYSKRLPNTYKIIKDICYIDLRDNAGVVIGETLIDTSLADRVLKYRWCMDSSGYAIGRVENKLTRLHKFLLPKPRVLDHANRNKLDNRIINLRDCSHSQNSSNSGGVHRSSKYKGVSRAKGKHWAVYALFANSNKRFWGYYPTEQEAALAYNKFAKEFGDEFTFINKI